MNLTELAKSYKFTKKCAGGGSGGGGTGSGIIEVDELPIENIDENANYVLKGYSYVDVYLSVDGGVWSLSTMLRTINPNGECFYYVVDTLPDNPQASDFATMSVFYVYINTADNIPYIYGNAGAGDMWLPANQLLASMGTPLDNKGFVDCIDKCGAVNGVYVTYLHNATAECLPDLIFDHGEWKRKAEVLSLNANLYRKEITEDDLEGFTSIRPYMFCDIRETESGGMTVSTPLEKIIMPDSIIYISQRAFQQCDRLKTVICNGVKVIDAYAFQNCAQVECYNLPNIEILDEGAFYNNSNLHTVSFGNKLTYIPSTPFACESGKEIANLTINYAGTKEQWKAVTKFISWDNGLTDYTIYCTDGTIAKDGTET